MNKQIEEMAKYFCHPCDFECGGGCELGHKIGECPIANETAKILYNAGYRRQDEVARDIFTQLEEEIEAAIKSNYIARTEHLKKYPENYNLEIVSNIHGKINALRGIQSFISILKIEYGVTEDESES